MKRLLILVAGLLMVEESFALPKCPPWRIFSNLAVVACTYTWANWKQVRRGIQGRQEAWPRYLYPTRMGNQVHRGIQGRQTVGRNTLSCLWQDMGDLLKR